MRLNGQGVGKPARLDSAAAASDARHAAFLAARLDTAWAELPYFGSSADKTRRAKELTEIGRLRQQLCRGDGAMARQALNDPIFLRSIALVGGGTGALDFYALRPLHDICKSVAINPGGLVRQLRAQGDWACSLADHLQALALNRGHSSCIDEAAEPWRCVLHPLLVAALCGGPSNLVTAVNYMRDLAHKDELMQMLSPAHSGATPPATIPSCPGPTAVVYDRTKSPLAPIPPPPPTRQLLHSGHMSPPQQGAEVVADRGAPTDGLLRLQVSGQQVVLCRELLQDLIYQ